MLCIRRSTSVTVPETPGKLKEKNSLIHHHRRMTYDVHWCILRRWYSPLHSNPRIMRVQYWTLHFSCPCASSSQLQSIVHDGICKIFGVFSTSTYASLQTLQTFRSLDDRSGIEDKDEHHKLHKKIRNRILIGGIMSTALLYEDKSRQWVDIWQRTSVRHNSKENAIIEIKYIIKYIIY